MPKQLEDIPYLPGYVSIGQAARILGISKTSVYYKIYTQQQFKFVFRVGDPEPGDRPFLLLMRDEVEKVLKEDQDPEGRKPIRQRLHEWNLRVKGWGFQHGYTDSATERGRPSLKLVQDYLAAHPDDIRPA